MRLLITVMVLTVGASSASRALADVQGAYDSPLQLIAPAAFDASFYDTVVPDMSLAIGERRVHPVAEAQYAEEPAVYVGVGVLLVGGASSASLTAQAGARNDVGAPYEFEPLATLGLQIRF